MEISIARYAEIHGIAMRTAYRRVLDGGNLADGDKIVRHGKRCTVQCAHVGNAGAVSTPSTAKTGNCQSKVAKLANSAISRPGDAETKSPFDMLLMALGRHRVSDPREIEHLVDAWAKLSVDSQTAVISIDGALDNFVAQNRQREVLLRARVEDEGRRRQIPGKGGCRNFDSTTTNCRVLKDRRTGHPFRPSLVSCALCPDFDRRILSP